MSYCGLKLAAVFTPSILSVNLLVIILGSTCAMDTMETLLRDQKEDEISKLLFVVASERHQLNANQSSKGQVRAMVSNLFPSKGLINQHSDKAMRQSLTWSANHRLRVFLHSNFGRAKFGWHRIFWVKATLVCAYALLALIGLVSNLLVVCIILFIRRKALASITNIFVLVLAISDVIICVFNIPVQAYYELRETVSLTNISCKVIFSLFALPTHVSCLTMLLIACDRYQIIIHPLLPRMSTKMAVGLTVVIVIMGLVNSIPLAVYSTISYAIPSYYSEKEDEVIENTKFVRSNHRFDEPHTYCVEDWPSADARLLYSIVVFCVHFAIPLVITALLYGRIYLRLHERQIHRQSVERKRRTNRILIQIVMCFAILWSPWIFFSLWLEVNAHDIQRQSLAWVGTNQSEDVIDHLIADEHKSFQVPNDHPVVLKMRNMDVTIRLIDLLLKLVAMSSSCINPWLYGWLSKPFCTFFVKCSQRNGHKLQVLMKPMSSTARKHDLPSLRIDQKTHSNPNLNESQNQAKIDEICERYAGGSRCRSECCGINLVFYVLSISKHSSRATHPRSIKQDKKPEIMQNDVIIHDSKRMSRKSEARKKVCGSSLFSSGCMTNSKTCSNTGCGLCASLKETRPIIVEPDGGAKVDAPNLHDETTRDGENPELKKIGLLQPCCSSTSVNSNNQSTRVTTLMPYSSCLAITESTHLPTIDHGALTPQSPSSIKNFSRGMTFQGGTMLALASNHEGTGLRSARCEPSILQVMVDRTVSGHRSGSTQTHTSLPYITNLHQASSVIIHLKIDDRYAKYIPFIDDVIPVTDAYKEENREPLQCKNSNSMDLSRYFKLSIQNTFEKDMTNIINNYKFEQLSHPQVGGEPNPNRSTHSRSPMSMDKLLMDETDSQQGNSVENERLLTCKGLLHQPRPCIAAARQDCEAVQPKTCLGRE